MPNHQPVKREKPAALVQEPLNSSSSQDNGAIVLTRKYVAHARKRRSRNAKTHGRSSSHGEVLERPNLTLEINDENGCEVFLRDFLSQSKESLS